MQSAIKIQKNAQVSEEFSDDRQNHKKNAHLHPGVDLLHQGELRGEDLGEEEDDVGDAARGEHRANVVQNPSVPLPPERAEDDAVRCSTASFIFLNESKK
jgi:hypothetical protein